MNQRDEIILILSKHKAQWAKRYKLKKIALFGSYARDEQLSKSDVDILVEVDPSIGLEFVSLAEAIEKALGKKADVISTRAVSERHWKLIEPELIYVQ